MSSNIPNGMTNEHGQGASHAKDSALPGKVQDKVPSNVEVLSITMSHIAIEADNYIAPCPGQCTRHW